MPWRDCPGGREHSMIEPVAQRHDVKTLAIRISLPYGLSMSDFLEYLRLRRAQIRKELQDLETAEQVYRQSNRTAADVAVSELIKQPALFRTVADAAVDYARKPKTI